MQANTPKRKKLRPITVNPVLEKNLQKEILYQIYQIVYEPVIKLCEEANVNLVINSPNYSALITALMKGRISYIEDHFEGEFNAAISRDLQNLGAKRIKTGWHIPKDNLPGQVNIALANANNKFLKLSNKIVEALSIKNIEKLASNISNLFTAQYFKELNRLDKIIGKNVKSAAKSIQVAPELSPEIKEKIAKDYANNLELYIQDFSAQEVVKLRELVQQNVFKGNRSTELKKLLIGRFGVSSRKAEFLSKQETSLLTSTYTFSRYQDLDIEEYQWSTSHDSRVRHDHRELDGKVFRFDKPPVVEHRTGRRANPGIDFGCRCVAIPLVKT